MSSFTAQSAEDLTCAKYLWTSAAFPHGSVLARQRLPKKEASATPNGPWAAPRPPQPPHKVSMPAVSLRRGGRWGPVTRLVHVRGATIALNWPARPWRVQPMAVPLGCEGASRLGVGVPTDAMVLAQRLEPGHHAARQHAQSKDSSLHASSRSSARSLAMDLGQHRRMDAVLVVGMASAAHVELKLAAVLQTMV